MSDLTVFPRSRWNAREPRPMTVRSLKTIHELFIHWPGIDPRSWKHVNTVAEEHSAIRGIQDFHMDAPDHGWSDIAYNGVIVPNYGREDQSPNVYQGRDLVHQPAAQLGHNEGTAALLILIGPDDFLSEDVKRRIRSYIRWLEDKTGNNLSVRPHKAVTSTECPGPALSKYVATL